jgi:hypothetical protein
MVNTGIRYIKKQYKIHLFKSAAGVLDTMGHLELQVQYMMLLE